VFYPRLCLLLRVDEQTILGLRLSSVLGSVKGPTPRTPEKMVCKVVCL